MSPARALAFRVLCEVEEGGYASDLLHFRSRGLDSRDAGLATEIVLGTLRRQAQLDFLIRHFSGSPPERLDLAVRVALRMGLYQLHWLERVPPHAATSESVDLVKRARKRSAAGLVNAVLRKAAGPLPPWPDRPTALSVPAWLLARWEQAYGAQTAAGIAESFLRPAESRVNLETGRIQDPGSQSIVALLELSPGQTFLDLCAAPGNKTAQAIAAGVRALACDRNLRRLRALDGLACERVVLDATRPLPFRSRFDRILLDAPCSGTGTLGRNPEIRWRLKPQDLADLHARQVAMLRAALPHLAPGGLLVYATCSLEREENEEVVEEALGCRPPRTVRRLPGLQEGDGFFAAVIPSN